MAAFKKESFIAPRWLVEGEQAKSGAGLLFFAYGNTKTLQHFLLEAESAGRTFRTHNPGISIAVVTNNATVDTTVFDTHIRPKMDLLFPGDTGNHGQNRGDNLPRQWLTRLYYLAQSPYELTWALDSNVISCTPGAAQVFLNNALYNKLWGYDIAHGSQNLLSDVMYPHNFNIVYRWSSETSALLRDWFLIMMRLGVTADDQKTLHMAELRANHRSGLHVGKVAPAFGAAFYTVWPHQPNSSKGYATVGRTDSARISQAFSGLVHVLHTPNLSLCSTFNEHYPTMRQVCERALDHALNCHFHFSHERVFYKRTDTGDHHRWGAWGTHQTV